MFIRNKNHHRANKQGYVKIADIVLEQKIGRKLLKNEIAHHIDGNKFNDSVENLKIMDNYKHTIMHLKLRKNS